MKEAKMRVESLGFRNMEVDVVSISYLGARIEYEAQKVINSVVSNSNLFPLRILARHGILNSI